jgi:predicted MFS family arabinose efflux permease
MAALSLVGTALVAASWIELAACAALGGMANGLIQPATSLLLVDRVQPDRLGLAFGVKQTSPQVAILLSGVGLFAVVDALGWRWAFGIGAAASITLAALVCSRRWPTISRSAADRPKVDAALVPRLALLGLAGGLGTIAANSLGAFYVASSAHAGFAGDTVGTLLILGSIAGIIARLTSGWFIDHSLKTPLATAGRMLAVSSVAYLALGFVDGLVLYAVLTVVVFTAGWGWPGLLQLAVVRRHLDAPAAASGIVQAGALTGALVGPVVFGLVADGAGFAWAWGMTAAAAVIGGAAMLYIDRRDPVPA